MIRSKRNYIYRAALGISLTLAVTGCSHRQSDGTTLVDAISKAVGFSMPSGVTILAYHHQHDDTDAPQCSQLWVVQTPAPFAGPDRRVSQTCAKSPFKSLKLLVEQATDGRVVIEAADETACRCVEWRHGETMCRLRQAQTRDGWIAVLEAILPQ